MAGKSKIKILFTIPNFDTAGSGKALLKVAERLDKELFEPHIACFHNKGQFFEKVEQSGIPVHLIEYTHSMRPVWKGLVHCWKVSRFFRKNHFDIIHSYHYAPDYSEAIAAKMAGCKWVFTKKNMNWGGASKNGWKLRSFLADAIAIQNQDMKERFYPKCDKTVYIPRGVDVCTYFPIPKDASLLEELHITNRERVILAVANIVPVKGIDLLVRAYAKLFTPNTMLVLVGNADSDCGASVKRMVQSMNLEAAVIFTGKRLDVARFYSIADICVSPTTGIGEGSSVAILEAMASGCIIIGSNVPGTKEQLACVPELLFAPGDMASLLVTLDRAMSYSPDDRQIIIKRLLETINSKYTLDLEVSRHAMMYQKLLRRC